MTIFTIFVLAAALDAPVIQVDSISANTMGQEGQWNIFWRTDAGALKADTRYCLEFDYTITAREPAEGYFFYMTESEVEKQAHPWSWRSYTAWKEDAVTAGHVVRRIILGPYDDYRLMLAIHKQGGIEVRNLSIRELAPYPAMDALAPGLAPAPASMPWEPFGVCSQATQTWVYKSDDEVRRAMRMIAAMGAQWVRLGLGWTFSEPEKGKVGEEHFQRLDAALAAADELGLRCYLQLLGVPKWASTNPDHTRFWAFPPKDMEDWRRFVRDAARRYGAKVDYWEVGNEWDWEFWEGTVEEFASLLKETSAILREGDPGCRIILGGTATDGANAWSDPRAKKNALQRLYHAGAGPAFDIMSVHPYSTTRDNGVYESVDKINTACAIMTANGDAAKPIWITEIGADTLPISLEQQASYLRQVYTLLLHHPRVEKIFWYNFRCIGTDPKDQQHNFGVVNNDFSPRPAYDAYKQLDKTGPRLIAPGLVDILPGEAKQ